MGIIEGLTVEYLSWIGMPSLIGGFISSVVFSIWGHRIAGELAQWLYHNRRDAWREMGRPGTRSFKGEPDNDQMSRISALNGMIKLMPLHQYKKSLANGGEHFVERYQWASKMSLFSMFIFFFGIGVQLLRENLMK